jgi:hypothetical protein
MFSKIVFPDFVTANNNIFRQYFQTEENTTIRAYKKVDFVRNQKSAKKRKSKKTNAWPALEEVVDKHNLKD